ncbi:MAG: amino acid permease [Saprospiraceae bacterium]
MLKREIGVLGLASNIVNIILGAGIFILPPLVYHFLGPASIVAYLICGALIFTIMLCFAEIGSLFTSSGGAFYYIHEVFGDYFGFLANFLFWFGAGVLMNAALVNAMADMLQISSLPYRSVFFLVIFGGLACINIRGVKYGNRFVIFTTFMKLIPLLLIICFGISHITLNNLKWVANPGMDNIGNASLLLFFAFAGGEAALNVSGEIKNPSKTIPRGILLGLTILVLIYILIQIVSQGILGNTLPDFKDAPLSAVAQRIFGTFGVGLVLAGSIVSIFGNLSGSVLSYPRLIMSGAERDWLPKFLSFIHPRFATPYWSIAVYTALVFIFSISGEFKSLMIITSATLLLIDLGVVLALIKIKLNKKMLNPNMFRLPFGITIPVVAAISILWFLAHLSSKEIFAFGIAFTVLSVIYLMMKKSAASLSLK